MTSLRDIERSVARIDGVARASTQVVAGRGRLRLRFEPGVDRPAVCQRVADVLRDGFGLDLDPADLLAGAEPAEETASDAARFRHELPPLTAATSTARRATDEELVHEARNGAVDGTWSTSGSTRPQATRGRRPVLRDLAVERGSIDAKAVVRLDLGGQESTGEGVGAGTDLGALTAVAAATIDACRVYAEDGMRAHVDQVLLEGDGAARRVTVMITMASDLGRDRLIGQALITDDSALAAAKATLDAVNRRLGLLLEAVG